MPRKKTHEEFVEDVYCLVKDEFIILSKYKNAMTKVEIKHNNKDCNNHVFSMKPNSFLNGQRCPKCALELKRKKRAFSNEDYQNKLAFEFDGEFSTTDNYYNTNTIMTFTHSICGRNFNTTPKSLFRHRKCHHCAKEHSIEKRTKSQEQFENEVFNLFGEEYTVISEYVNAHKHVIIRHNNIECNFNEYKVSPHNILHGFGCPKCNNPSRGEKLISKHLDELHISYIQQYKFEDCKNSYPLPFDFAIFDGENKELILLIEYDGKQHFEPVNYGGISDEKAITNLEYVKNHDNIKNTYCVSNDIQLLRIPYWDFKDIHKILIDELSKYKLIKKELSTI